MITLDELWSFLPLCDSGGSHDKKLRMEGNVLRVSVKIDIKINA